MQPTLIEKAYIRASGVDLDREGRAYLRRKLGRKLGKFARMVERVSVRIEDVNGPRGGHDQQTRIKVVLKGRPSVVVAQRSASLQRAMDGALGQIETAVRRALGRTRTVRRRMRHDPRRANAASVVTA